MKKYAFFIPAFFVVFACQSGSVPAAKVDGAPGSGATQGTGGVGGVSDAHSAVPVVSDTVVPSASAVASAPVPVVSAAAGVGGAKTGKLY
jgi:hypothetical protein